MADGCGGDDGGKEGTDGGDPMDATDGLAALPIDAATVEAVTLLLGAAVVGGRA